MNLGHHKIGNFWKFSTFLWPDFTTKLGILIFQCQVTFPNSCETGYFVCSWTRIVEINCKLTVNEIDVHKMYVLPLVHARFYHNISLFLVQTFSLKSVILTWNFEWTSCEDFQFWNKNGPKIFVYENYVVSFFAENINLKIIYLRL